MSKHIPNSLNNIFKDTIWSITGLVLMNLAAQFVVYPYWNRVLGSEEYGNIVYLLAIMNVMAISVGSGVNYTRMRRSVDEDTQNRPYIILMIIGSVLSVSILLIMYAFGFLRLGIREFILFCVLTVATMWRYYADVEYRLHINYKGYFQYYLIIGLGYLCGIFLFKKYGFWPLSLLPGELAGLLTVYFHGSIFRTESTDICQDISKIMPLANLLIGTNILSYLVFNGDRFILQWFADSTAVSVYYIASLFGKTVTLITTPLNGVLVGHLAKYNGALTKTIKIQVLIVSAVAIVLVTMVSCMASVIVLPVLYPFDYLEVKKYIIVANSAQVIYFIGNVVISSILLMFTRVKNQLFVNVVHGVLFVCVCVPTTYLFKIEGFCWSLLIVNIIRWLLCLVIINVNSKGNNQV